MRLRGAEAKNGVPRTIALTGELWEIIQRLLLPGKASPDRDGLLISGVRLFFGVAFTHDLHWRVFVEKLGRRIAGFEDRLFHRPAGGYSSDTCEIQIFRETIVAEVALL